MAKYTKRVMKRLHGIDVYVFFCSMWETNYRALFRDKGLPPYNVGDMHICQKDPKCSITFCSKLYKKDRLAPHAWFTISHEVTHFEEKGMIEDDNGELHHSERFNEILKSNLERTDDLRKQFNIEVGWDEDFVYEEDVE